MGTATYPYLTSTVHNGKQSSCAILSHIPRRSMGKATPLPKLGEEPWQEVLHPVRTRLLSATSQGHPGCTGTEIRTTAKFPQSRTRIWEEDFVVGDNTVIRPVTEVIHS
jgi:hypothetical protein